MSILVVYNSSSGRADHLDDIKKAFARRGLSPDYIAITARGLGRRLHAAASEKGATIVAAGGDGTVNAVANLVGGTDCKLGIIPSGTLNHFAKELGVPLDIAEAVGVIAHGKTRLVDMGSVNDHEFVNNSSIGIYPRSLRTRDEYGHKVGKWPAAIIGFARAAFRPKRYHVDLTVEGKQLTFRTPFVLVANNPYQRGPNIGKRAALDGGQLAIYVIKAHTALGIVRTLAQALFTRKHRTPDFAVYLAPKCSIHTRHHRGLSVACDGEVLRLATPLHYRSQHRSLRVIAP